MTSDSMSDDEVIDMALEYNLDLFHKTPDGRRIKISAHDARALALVQPGSIYTRMQGAARSENDDDLDPSVG